MAVATASVAHAVSVWVVHSVTDPVRLFVEAARVIRPGGRYVVCSNQSPAPDDPIGQIIAEMGRRVDVRRGASRPRGVTAQEVLAWAGEAIWPAMRELDESSIEEATRPAIEALEALPAALHHRRATAHMIVLIR
jgi:ubiquinone/menaquinone biosynthesis C-methylase UbiE